MENKMIKLAMTVGCLCEEAKTCISNGEPGKFISHVLSGIVIDDITTDVVGFKGFKDLRHNDWCRGRCRGFGKGSDAHRGCTVSRIDDAGVCSRRHKPQSRIRKFGQYRQDNANLRRLDERGEREKKHGHHKGSHEESHPRGWGGRKRII